MGLPVSSLHSLLFSFSKCPPNSSLNIPSLGTPGCSWTKCSSEISTTRTQTGNPLPQAQILDTIDQSPIHITFQLRVVVVNQLLALQYGVLSSTSSRKVPGRLVTPITTAMLAAATRFNSIRTTPVDGVRVASAIAAFPLTFRQLMRRSRKIIAIPTVL